MTLKINDTIYKYKLIKKLGAGSFGEVWLANDTSINNQVALKILPSNFSKIAALLEEARIGHKIKHENLLQIQYADVIDLPDGNACTLIAQDYKSHGTIENLLNSQNFLDTPQLIKALKDILYGLEYLHNSNIFHNDIKPGNILLGDNNEAILADYGISGITTDGKPVIPKNIYIMHGAPESLSSNPIIDVRTDIYQLGCTAYRLANGIGELHSNFINIENFKQQVSNGTISNKPHQLYVPIKLGRIIKKAMALNPSDRYQSALEMRRDLEKLSFAGYWTADLDRATKLIGIGNNYKYRFDTIARPNNKFELIAFRINKQGRETRITNFCHKGLSTKDLLKQKKKYFQWVINNAR